MPISDGGSSDWNSIKLERRPASNNGGLFYCIAMNLDFEKSGGLITAVIQDYLTGRVLMVGYMNQEAFQKTVETGFATFYRRSRRKLWRSEEHTSELQSLRHL